MAKDFEIYKALGLFSNYTKRIKYREVGSKSRYSTTLCTAGTSNAVMIDLFAESIGVKVEIKPTINESIDTSKSGSNIT